MLKLSVDLMNHITKYNTHTDQIALKCSHSFMRELVTSSKAKEIKLYKYPHSVLKIAHSNNLNHVVTSNNNELILRNIWWYGVSHSFQLSKGTYVITMIQNVVSSSNMLFEINITFNDVSKKIFAAVSDSTRFILDVPSNGQLKIELDEHNSFKQLVSIYAMYCIPFYIYKQHSLHRRVLPENIYKLDLSSPNNTFWNGTPVKMNLAHTNNNNFSYRNFTNRFSYDVTTLDAKYKLHIDIISINGVFSFVSACLCKEYHRVMVCNYIDGVLVPKYYEEVNNRYVQECIFNFINEKYGNSMTLRIPSRGFTNYNLPA